jgi:hypothetical protein
MLKTWEKVFFIAIIVIVIALIAFHKEIETFFSPNSQQEQVIDAGGKKENEDKKNKKDKEDKKDKNDKDIKD